MFLKYGYPICLVTVIVTVYQSVLRTDIYPLELVIKNVLTGTKNSLTEAATLTIWSGYQSRELRISDRVNTYTMFHMTESTLGTFFSSAELFINIHTVEK